MEVPTWEIVGTFLIVLPTVIFLTRKLNYYKLGKNIWEEFSGVAKESDLELQDSLILLSDWPNLLGKVKGRMAYIHPDKGGRKKPAKTIFAVKSNIAEEYEAVIVRSGDAQPEDTYKIDVPSLKNYNYEVFSKSKLDGKRLDKLFSKSVTGKMDELVIENNENFRAFVLEPGLMMFSTFNITIDKKTCLKNLELLGDIVKEMEKDSESTNDGFVNPRLDKLSEGPKSNMIKGVLIVFMIGISIAAFYRTLLDFSLFFLNLGVATMLLGLSSFYTSLMTSWKYQ